MVIVDRRAKVKVDFGPERLQETWKREWETKTPSGSPIKFQLEMGLTPLFI